MITYKDIIDELRAYCDAHEMINSFGHGLIADENGGKDISYPKVFVRPTGTQVENTFIAYGLDIEVYGLANYDNDQSEIEAQEVQILSDCMQIVKDIRASVRLGTDWFFFDGSNPIIDGGNSVAPFMDFKAQRETGWILSLSLQAINQDDACTIPLATRPREDCPAVTVTDSVGGESYTVIAGDTTAIPKHTIYESDGLTVVTTLEYHENYTTPACADATATDSLGGSILTIPSGGTQVIPKHRIYESDGVTPVASLEYNDDYSVPTHSIFKSDGSTLVQEDEFNEDYTTPLATVTRTNGDDTTSTISTVEAGETLNLPKIAVTENLGAGQVAYSDQGTNKTLNINAEIDTLVEDATSITITPVAVSSTPRRGKKPPRIWQTFTQFTGDCGWHLAAGTYDEVLDFIPRRLQDIFNLHSGSPNPHTGTAAEFKRLTGTTGGYYDEGTSTFKDINGTTTTEALAFPSDLMIDWASDLIYAKRYYGLALPAAAVTQCETVWALTLPPEASSPRICHRNELDGLQIYDGMTGRDFIEPLQEPSVVAVSNTRYAGTGYVQYFNGSVWTYRAITNTSRWYFVANYDGY